jgi:hypothetical protein
MNFFKKPIDPEKSWEHILWKLGVWSGDRSNISLKNLEFSSTFIPGGFPTELILTNSHTKVCVYDNNFEINVGESSVNHTYDNNLDGIFVRSVLTKEQFNYLYMVSLSPKKITIEFVTPWFGVDKLKNLSINEPIVFNNCTFMIHGEPTNAKKIIT